MAFTAAGVIIGNLPWKEIIRHTPTLVESSRKLYASLRKPRDQAETSVDELRSTLRELESRAAEQSRLGTEVAQQIDSIAQGIDELEARIVSLEQSSDFQRRNQLVIMAVVAIGIFLSGGAVIGVVMMGLQG